MTWSTIMHKYCALTNVNMQFHFLLQLFHLRYSTHLCSWKQEVYFICSRLCHGALNQLLFLVCHCLSCILFIKFLTRVSPNFSSMRNKLLQSWFVWKNNCISVFIYPGFILFRKCQTLRFGRHCKPVWKISIDNQISDDVKIS